MADLNLTTFDKLYPMIIHKYNELFDDQNASVMDRINTIVDYLNQVGKLTNDVVKDWNTVYNWAMNDGLTQDVSNKIEQLKADGYFDSLISTIVAMVGDLSTLKTSVKDTVVDSINSIQDEVNMINQLINNTVTYSYDSNGKIQTVTQTDTNNVVLQTITYTYNANGDIDTSVTTSNGNTVTKTYSYDGNARLTSITNTLS